MSDKLPFCFEQVVDSAKDVIIITTAQPISDTGPEIVYVNKAFETVTGYSADEAIGKTPRILQSENTCDETKKTIRKALEKEQPVSVIIQNRTKQGRDYWIDLNIIPLTNDDGKVTHYAAIERDCTHFKQKEKALEAMSLSDPLTKLYNRRAINERIPLAFEKLKANDTNFVVMTIDIDHFKSVNDRFGHDMGDRVIIEISRLISNNMRNDDWAARAGGEEFIAVMQNIDINEAATISERIRHDVEKHIFKSDGDIFFKITVSIGLAVSDITDEDEWQVMRRSDKALYDSKNTGRNRICIR